MDTAQSWTKRAGLFERQAQALLNASEDCLSMAEAIRQATHKGAQQEEEQNFRPAPRTSRRADG